MGQMQEMIGGGGGTKLKNDAWMVLVIFPNKRE